MSKSRVSNFEYIQKLATNLEIPKDEQGLIEEINRLQMLMNAMDRDVSLVVYWLWSCAWSSSSMVLAFYVKDWLENGLAVSLNLGFMVFRVRESCG